MRDASSQDADTRRLNIALEFICSEATLERAVLSVSVLSSWEQDDSIRTI